MKGQFSRLPKSAASNIFWYFVLFRVTRAKDWFRAWEGKIGYCELCCWQQQVFGLQKVGSRSEIYSARWKLILISDQAKDFVKNCFEGGGAPCLLLNRWFTSGILNKSILWVEKSFYLTIYMWRKREFYEEIWRWFARVKCRNIMSGFRKCCDCRVSRLLCDLPKERNSCRLFHQKGAGENNCALQYASLVINSLSVSWFELARILSMHWKVRAQKFWWLFILRYNTTIYGSLRYEGPVLWSKLSKDIKKRRINLQL